MTRNIILTVLLVSLLAGWTFGADSSQTPQRSESATAGKEWKAGLVLFGASALTDARTTQIALSQGYTEAGFPYRWVPPKQVTGALVMGGIAEGALLTRLHRTHPRLAWTLLILSSAVKTGAAIHNTRP